VEQFPTLIVNDEKLQDQTYAAKAFSNFFITIITTEHSSNRERRFYPNSKTLITWKLPQHKNNSTY